MIAAVNIGVYELIKQIGAAPLEGSIIKVDGATVYVNLGADVIVGGDMLTAVAKGWELIHPDTGLSLGGEEEEIGTLKVVDVKEKYCLAEPVGFDAGRLRRGDKVISTKDPPALQFASSWPGKKKE